MEPLNDKHKLSSSLLCSHRRNIIVQITIMDGRGHFVISLYFSCIHLRRERLLNPYSFSLSSSGDNNKGFWLSLSGKIMKPCDTDVWNLQKLLWDWTLSCRAPALGSGSDRGPHEGKNEDFWKQCWAWEPDSMQLTREKQKHDSHWKCSGEGKIFNEMGQILGYLWTSSKLWNGDIGKQQQEGLACFKF